MTAQIGPKGSKMHDGRRRACAARSPSYMVVPGAGCSARAVGQASPSTRAPAQGDREDLGQRRAPGIWLAPSKPRSLGTGTAGSPPVAGAQGWEARTQGPGQGLPLETGTVGANIGLASLPRPGCGGWRLDPLATSLGVKGSVPHF